MVNSLSQEFIRDHYCSLVKSDLFSFFLRGMIKLKTVSFTDPGGTMLPWSNFFHFHAVSGKLGK